MPSSDCVPDNRPNEDVAHSPHVAVIGAGLAGLACATYLTMNGVRVTLIEKEDRVGGQCWTRYEDNGVIWEAGGEGFVRRAVAVPKIANALGIEEDMLPQEPVENYEIEENYAYLSIPNCDINIGVNHTASLREVFQDNLGQKRMMLIDVSLTSDPPRCSLFICVLGSVDRLGEAARKLGFQVKKEDFGRGIASFREGMGELVDSMHSCLKESPLCTVFLNDEVASLERDANQSNTMLTLAGGEKLIVDEVVIATPEKEACAMLGRESNSTGLMSHVSVYCLVRMVGQASDHWHSFSVPAEMQDDLHGLRAVALVNEKFPGRSPAGTALFRCYYRPRAEPLREWSDEEWSKLASESLMKICSFTEQEVLSSYVSRWDSALPVFNDEYRAAVEQLKESVVDQHVHLIGAAFTGAGIEAAVKSGEEAAVEILKKRPQSSILVAVPVKSGE
ncbi:hypothetical protein FOZ61_000287 [Perkinsus olseni]|uniref:Amine oxidase domain-containing protein n=1 Tax=Perkinsus olseni TaxID=32597 RepID=A0A7J6KV78_PEROL|nr:hypothetical protein FOZ61_000287 [Perkinsus olseni]KAF4651560.1 hypothetical protein FOL46_000253 [Perkinsus olseni]